MAYRCQRREQINRGNLLIKQRLVMEKDQYVKVLFRHDAFGEGIEGAWSKPQGKFFVLDNILFYAKEYSWGNVIDVEKEGDKLYAKNLVRESGHSTIRVLLSDPQAVSRIRSDVSQMGCSPELSNMKNLISIDVPPSLSYDALITYLNKGEEKEEWEYEEACISKVHRQQV